MNKQVLLPRKSSGMNYYKANLHCHSTLSDGSCTPSELKEIYKKHGYSIIAYTDHDVFIPHNDLTDEEFLALNGFEFEIFERSGEKNDKTCHLCYIALDKDNDKSICYHRSKYLFANAANQRHLLKFDENEPDYERVYTPECINDMIKKGRENRFFVTYNHPTWSQESYPEYMSYCGMNAMEIVNYGCVTEGYDDVNGHCYDDMLRGGKRIFCTATDDNHNRFGENDKRCDSFGGYTVIAAPSLSYEDITNALTNGSFYAAYGNSLDEAPEIKYLEYDSDSHTVLTECSPAEKITLISGARVCKVVYGADCAEFKIDGDEKYFRLEVFDKFGHRAFTNAYFI